MGINQSFAQRVVTFGPEETKIKGSIAYTELGKYRAQFDAFKGRITLNDNLQKIQSVYLVIDVKSIHSNCSWCDKMARSRRLLNAARYPKIVFKSDQIIKDARGYQVKGILEMHGIKKGMIFPFKVVNFIDQRTKHQWLDISGTWNINRKDFNIIWSKTLDHGGILVGDIFTVDWAIRIVHRS